MVSFGSFSTAFLLVCAVLPDDVEAFLESDDDVAVHEHEGNSVVFIGCGRSCGFRFKLIRGLNEDVEGEGAWKLVRST